MVRNSAPRTSCYCSSLGICDTSHILQIMCIFQSIIYGQNLYTKALSLTRFDGHSGGDTPGLIPNPAVKPTCVLRCTVVRESTGTAERCQPLSSLGSNSAGSPSAKKRSGRVASTSILQKLRVSLLVLHTSGVQKTPVILSLIGLKVLSENFCFRMNFYSMVCYVIGFYSSRVIGSTHLNDSN